MAVALEDANLVRQKTKIALMNAHPVIQDGFGTLERYLATHAGNPNLQFLPFSDALLTTATGYTPVAAACKLYGVYFIKNGLLGAGTATDSWLTIANDTSNVTDATKFVALMTSADEDEVFAIYPDGMAFGTDITFSGETSAQDGTESTASDSGNGFAIIGAA